MDTKWGVAVNVRPFGRAVPNRSYTTCIVVVAIFDFISEEE